MAASLLRIGRLGCIKCFQAESWCTPNRVPAARAFSTKSGGSKKSSNKNSFDKKQAKTYFDIEKLVQHKPCDVFPARAAAAKPAAEAISSAAPPEFVGTDTSAVTSNLVVEATPTAEAEAAPVIEIPPAIEAIPESALAVGAIPVVEDPTEAAPIVATVAEALPVVDAVPVPLPAEDFAISASPALGVETPVEAVYLDPADEAALAPEVASEATVAKAAPVVESASVEGATVVEAASEFVLVEPAPEPEAAPEFVLSEPAPEPVTEVAPVVEAAPEFVHFEPAPEPVTEAAPVVEAASEFVLVDVTPEPVAKVEVSAPVENPEEHDNATVIAEATGEELQREGPAESVEPSEAHLDPVKKLFLDSIREYSTKSQASGGLVDEGTEYKEALAKEIAKLQRLYGGGDLTSFPVFKFTEPKLDEVSQK